MESSTAEATAVVYLLALAVTLLVCVKATAVGQWLKVMAIPDLGRKRHRTPTPQVGGIAILLAVALWLAGVLTLGNGTDHAPLTALLFCALGVGLVGFTDDQRNTSPLSRIMFLVVFLAIGTTLDPGLITTKLHWASFDPGSISVWAYCLTAGIAVIGLVNAVNMADGQNGIVGSMFVVWSACLMFISHGPEQGLAVMMLLASMLFLIFNLFGHVFLGDCGTYGITFLLAMLAVGAHARGQVPIETIVVWFFIPVVDCLRLLISRPLAGRSPFDGDRDHFHHRLENKLGKHYGLLAYASVVASSSLVATLDVKFALLCLTLLSAFYFSFAWLADNSAETAQLGYSETHAPNVISIAGETKTTASATRS